MHTNVLLSKHMDCNHNLSINQMHVLILHTIASNSASAVFVLIVQVGNSCYRESTYTEVSVTDHKNPNRKYKVLRTLHVSS